MTPTPDPRAKQVLELFQATHRALLAAKARQEAPQGAPEGLRLVPPFHYRLTGKRKYPRNAWGRLSEQEAHFAMVLTIRETLGKTFWSVETPTPYNLTPGERDTKANRIDITLYDSRSAPWCNIELKADPGGGKKVRNVFIRDLLKATLIPGQPGKAIPVVGLFITRFKRPNLDDLWAQLKGDLETIHGVAAIDGLEDAKVNRARAALKAGKGAPTLVIYACDPCSAEALSFVGHLADCQNMGQPCPSAPGRGTP